MRGIRHSEKIQAGTDRDVGIRYVHAQCALEVPQGRARAAADVVDAALRIVRNRREINPERRVLVVDEVVLLVAALRQVKRSAGCGRFDDLAGDAHLAMTRGLAGTIGRGEPQHDGIESLESMKNGRNRRE